MMRKSLLMFLGLAVIILASGCSRTDVETTELRRFAVNDLKGLITRSNVELDRDHSFDGNGSLKISVAEPTTLRLYELSGLDIEEARLVYQARVRTADVEGRAYLEMWCVFEGKGEFFARDLSTPLSGTNEWSGEEIFFMLRKGERPDAVRLNFVIEGSGTAWIDDIQLKKAPLGT